MDKSDPPESFGVFKPVHHTLIVLRSESELSRAAELLLQQGFAESALTRYTPAEMIAQIDRELVGASPLAEFGQELNLIKAHRVLAERGSSFLVVHAPSAESAARVDAVLATVNAVSAQRYGRFITEELTAQTPPELAGVSSPLQVGSTSPPDVS